MAPHLLPPATHSSYTCNDSVISKYLELVQINKQKCWAQEQDVIKLHCELKALKKYPVSKPVYKALKRRVKSLEKKTEKLKVWINEKESETQKLKMDTEQVANNLITNQESVNNSIRFLQHRSERLWKTFDVVKDTYKPYCQNSNKVSSEMTSGRNAMRNVKVEDKDEDDEVIIISDPQDTKPSFLKPESAPELTKYMLQINYASIWCKSPTEVIAENSPYTIKRGDLTSLNPGKRLDDPVVDFYLRLIQKRSTQSDGDNPLVYCFFSTFYPLLSSPTGLEDVRDSTEGHDIFMYDLIFFPVCADNHWQLIVVDTHRRSIRSYNSLMKSNKKDSNICQKIMEFLEQEETKKKGVKGNWFILDWCNEVVSPPPQQTNGFDCGVFMLQYAEYLSRNQRRFNFSQEHMPYYRQRIMYEILSHGLLPMNETNNNSNLPILNNLNHLGRVGNHSQKRKLTELPKSEHDAQVIKSLRKKFNLDKSREPGIRLTKVDELSVKKDERKETTC